MLKNLDLISTELHFFAQNIFFFSNRFEDDNENVDHRRQP